jgi:hypothetical protein
MDAICQSYHQISGLVLVFLWLTLFGGQKSDLTNTHNVISHGIRFPLSLSSLMGSLFPSGWHFRAGHSGHTAGIFLLRPQDNAHNPELWQATLWLPRRLSCKMKWKWEHRIIEFFLKKTLWGLIAF